MGRGLGKSGEELGVETAREAWGKQGKSWGKDCERGLGRTVGDYDRLREIGPHSFSERLVFRVGRYPLIFNETSVSSGVTPTHFLGYSCFEWGNTPLVLQDIFTLSGLTSQQSAKKLQKFDIIYILQRE